MTERKTLKLIWGIVAVGIYLFVVGLLILYFNHRQTDEKKHYVKKDEHRIQVALSAPRHKILPRKPVKKKPKSKPKPKAKPHKRKRTPPKKETKKKVIKEKIIKKKVKKREENLTKKKPKSKPKDLFANVKTVKKKKPLIQITDKPIKSKPKKQLFEMVETRPSASERITHSLKNQKSMDSGVEDAYLAKVQRMLEGWPAQSDFAGEKVKVHLKIDPTGYFEFVIKRKSRNPAFNQALTEYLEQLQEFGFGPHKGSRTYLFEAEFIAKE
jgi:protein TonB